MENQVATVERLIKIDEVLHMCGLSRSSLYASIQRGEFPVQVKLSKKASAWVYSEVLAWMRARAALRQSKPNHATA
jgi:prophage regulatory protein